MTSQFPRLSRVVVLMAALGLVVSSAPGRAAEFSFPDPPGDATGFQVESTPRPSDPELDILSVSFSSDATSLHAVINLEALGTAPGATGSTRAAGFTYEGNQYWFRFQAPQPPFDTAIASGFIFRKGGTTIPCGRCSGKLDPKTKSVRFTAEYKSMTSGMKSEDPGITPIGPGSKVSALTAATYRSTVALAPLVDAARPEKETELTL